MDAVIQYIRDNPVVCANIIAFVAVAITFVSYQVNSSKKLLIMLCCSAFVSAISFAVLEAWTGVAMNCVVLLRNIIYYNKDKKFFSGRYIPFIFATAAAVFGVCTWTAWYCIFSILGLVIDCLALSSKSAQIIRISILVTAPLFFIYDLLTMNYLECVKETISVISVIIGILRYRKKKEAE